MKAIANELKRIAGSGEPASGGLLRRVFWRLRLRRPRINIEQDAARNRVERLFEINFRTTWMR